VLLLISSLKKDVTGINAEDHKNQERHLVFVSLNIQININKHIVNISYRKILPES